MKNYDHNKIEKKWQKFWRENGTYVTPDTKKGAKNEYFLAEFPYPSGNLHIGHWYALVLPDIYVRKHRMEGKNVLYPIGFDSFGLPAENAAIKRGLDPKKWTDENMETMRTQLASTGTSFDMSREVVTSDPAYYKWTQWLFLKMHERGLAYRKKSLVNWDPVDKTVLANEQVMADGTAERSGAKVEKRELEQWFLKITDYAERLVNDLEPLDWPKEIKDQQKNWMGRSEGAEISFAIQGASEKISVFTTRVDTLFGVTYVVLAPEHPLVQKLKEKIKNWKDVEKYIKATAGKSEIDRTNATKEKTGVRLEGVVAINPATKEEIPVFIADYALAHYGTGAVMAVPAHDERDFAFAKKFDLPVKEVVLPNIVDKRNPPVAGKKIVERKNIHAIVKDPKTGLYLGLKWKKFDWTTFPMGGVEEGEDVVAAAMREVKEETGFVNLKLVKVLDGQVRAEYFAAHKDQNRVSFTTAVMFELVDHEQVDVAQEEKDSHEIIWLDPSKLNYENMTHAEVEMWKEKMNPAYITYTGLGVLINSGSFSGMSSEEAKTKIAEEFGKLKITYKLRDWSIGRQRYWGCPVPIVYDPEGKAHPVPGEHLPWLLPTDVDYTPTGEPPLARSKELLARTEKLFGKGWKPDVETMDTFVDSSWYYIRYLDPKNSKHIADQKKIQDWMPISYYFGGAEHTTLHLLYSRFFYKVMYDIGLVSETEPYTRRLNRGLILGPDGNKMSKSKGNVVDPDELVERLGADTVRMYLAFIGPYNEAGSYPWDPNGVVGVRRFLEKIWKLQENLSEDTKGSQGALLNKAIKKVSEDIMVLKFNTAISQLMIFLNESKGQVSRDDYEVLLKLLAPFAPHITEEIWADLGHKTSIHLEEWPVPNADILENTTTKIIVQINGKMRGEFITTTDISEEQAKTQALSLESVVKWLGGKQPERVIFVPGRLVNIVIK